MSGALVLGKRDPSEVEEAPAGKVRLFVDEDGNLSAIDETGAILSPQAAITDLEALVATKQDAGTSATDTELAAAVSSLTTAISAKQDGSTAATDTELASAVSTLNSAITAKQDASSAATDAELAAAVAALSATMATDAELASAVSTINAAVALKQDAATAATDAELSAGLATKLDTTKVGAAGEAGKALAANDPAVNALIGVHETGPVLQQLGSAAIVDNGGRNICHLSNDGKYLVANKRTMLRISSNESGGWTDCHEFEDSVEHLVEMNDGEVLVFTGPDATKQGKVWRSTGWSWTNPTAATWAKVKQSNGVGAYFTATYGGIFYDYDHGVLLISEYGNKTGAEAGSARYVYRSLDNGLTWATIFDRQTYDGGGTGKHMHGCAYDAVWDRVWLTLGDDTNAIVYADNWREASPTWVTAQSDTSINGKYQSVAIVPLPKCILFGSDGWPNGIHRIMRADKNGASTKANPGAALESAYAMNAKGTLTHLFQQPFQARHVTDAPLLWPYGIAGTSSPPVGGLIATFDGGLTFTEIWRDSIPYAADGAFKVAVGPTQQNGKLLGTLDDGRQANWSKITFTGAPDRRRADTASHHHQHYRGGEDAIHPGGIRAAWGHHVIAPADPVSGGGPTALTANQPRGVRVVVPCRGLLGDLSVFIGTAGDGSTIYYDLAVYKELSTGYQWLWSKGKTLLPSKTSAESGEASILGNPVYPVEVGDELIFELVCSSVTPTFRTYANGPAVPLPKSFNPLSTATYKRLVQFSGSSAVLPLPTANAGEPSIAVPNTDTSGAINSAPLIFGRIAPVYT